MTDSLAAASTNMSQAQLLTEVQTSLLDKNLDAAKEQGQAMVQALTQSGITEASHPDKGNTINIMA